MSENETRNDGPRRRRRRRSNNNARNNQRTQNVNGKGAQGAQSNSQGGKSQGGKGQGSQPKPSAPKPQGRAGGAHEGAKNAGGGSGSGNRGNRNRRGGNSRGGSRSSNRSNNRSGRRPASSQYRRHSQRSSSQFNQQHSELPVSVETSAGGLVISGLAEAVGPDGSVDFSRIYVALIGRLDRRGRLLWSMPKGHVEPDESQHATAEREVWEETGIAGKVIADLGTIDYWFVSEGLRIHKTVHHHLLRYVDGNLNDEDPEVTEVTWLPVDQLVERLAYADERRLARQAYERLPDFARAEAKAGRSTPR